jgi:hypothetical protein
VQSISYPSAVSARSVLDDAALTTDTRVELRRDREARASFARLLRGPAKEDDRPDVALDAELVYDPADPARSIRISLSAASLPQGSEAAVICPDAPRIGIPRTRVEQGRFASVERAPGLFDRPRRLQLRFWLNGQPLLTGGSLALEVARVTTEQEAGLAGVMRDPASDLPVAAVPGDAEREVIVRLGQAIWVLQQG